jgi:micrococcal nuclease
VIDGDTFKIGERNIRVIGIDAAELGGECEAETVQAEASTRALQDWLNRGPFTLTYDPAEPLDKYGRELMTVTRKAADGNEHALANYMTEQGGAHGYDGNSPRGGWC